MIPLLVAFTATTQHQAHATSLAAIVPIAAAGTIPFALEGNIDIGIAIALTVGTLIGAPLGARLMAGTAEGTLKVVFGLFMIAVGVQMFLT